MTAPLNEDEEIPVWIRKIMKIAYHLLFGFAAAYAFLKFGGAKESLNAILYEMLTQVVIIGLVLCVIISGSKGWHFIYNNKFRK